MKNTMRFNTETSTSLAEIKRQLATVGTYAVWFRRVEADNEGHAIRLVARHPRHRMLETFWTGATDNGDGTYDVKVAHMVESA